MVSDAKDAEQWIKRLRVWQRKRHAFHCRGELKGVSHGQTKGFKGVLARSRRRNTTQQARRKPAIQ
ncbi:hypothetical protein DBR45_46445 [Pseudomonas sp. HMWF031]|nr:hypothetical protein DBR45_46445 [Pseudomonas sp. HMWF031]